jgi:hypothetical protein
MTTLPNERGPVAEIVRPQVGLDVRYPRSRTLAMRVLVEVMSERLRLADSAPRFEVEAGRCRLELWDWSRTPASLLRVLVHTRCGEAAIARAYSRVGAPRSKFGTLLGRPACPAEADVRQLQQELAAGGPCDWWTKTVATVDGVSAYLVREGRVEVAGADLDEDPTDPTRAALGGLAQVGAPDHGRRARRPPWGDPLELTPARSSSYVIDIPPSYSQDH